VEAGDDLGRLMASGGGDYSRQIAAGGVGLGSAAVMVAQYRIGAASANATIPVGAIGAQRRKSGAAEPLMLQEVSSQKDGRGSAGRGRMPIMTMTPPQHGQRPGWCNGRVSWTCSAGVSGRSSSRRQSASLSARWPLARKP
jgi:hypothetical protein